MTKNLWMTTALAIALVAGSGLAYSAGIDYLPSVLMFVAALMAMGVMMTAEDDLLRKYDTPHDEDTHPPQLVTLRAVRSTVLFVMIVLAIVMLVREPGV
jgi:hypothetical protein